MNKKHEDYVILIDTLNNKEYPYSRLNDVKDRVKMTAETQAIAAKTHWINSRYQLSFPNKPRDPIPVGRIGSRKKWADILDLWKDLIRESPGNRFSANEIYKAIEFSIQKGYCSFEYRGARYRLLDQNLEPVTPTLLPQIGSGDDLATAIAKIRSKALSHKLSPWAVALFAKNRKKMPLSDGAIQDLYWNS